MRLPVIPDVDSRDGSSNKDSRLTNLLAQKEETVQIASLRPGLSTIATASGSGRGSTSYNGYLITVFGTTLGYGETPTTIATVTGAIYDFAQSPV